LARPYDHQRLYDVRDQRDVVIEAVKKELGIHLSANHPSGKDHFGFSYDMVNSIEVWNSAIWSKNANAIMIWDDMLSSGRKLTGRGGSDSGKPVRFRIQLTGNVVSDSSYTIHVVKNGDDFGTYKAIGKVPMTEFTDTPATTGRTYYRVTVDGPPTAYPQVPQSSMLSGNMVGLSNPIYFNFDPNF
jgi:hypothetical protein